MVTKEEAKKRIESQVVMPPTTDATVAEGIRQLGEQHRLKVLANLRDNEAVIVSIGQAWSAYTQDPKETFVQRFFDNLTLYSASRKKHGAMARLQITAIAQSHASSSLEAKEGKVSRFLKAVGLKGD